MQADVEGERDPERFLARFGCGVQEGRVDDGEGPVQEADEAFDGDGEDGDRNLDLGEGSERYEVVGERKGESKPGGGEAARTRWRGQCGWVFLNLGHPDLREDGEVVPPPAELSAHPVCHGTGLVQLVEGPREGREGDGVEERRERSPRYSLRVAHGVRLS